LDAGIVLAAFQNHAWTNVYRLVVWWEFDERISDYICEPRDINDQTQGSDDIEPKEETVFEFINDHSVQPNLSSKQNHRYGKAAVEIIISAFVEAEDSNIITDQSKNRNQRHYNRYHFSFDKVSNFQLNPRIIALALAHPIDHMGWVLPH